MSAVRSSAALLVTAGLLAAIGVGAEWLARTQVEAVVRAVVDAELRQVSGDGRGFEQVDVDVSGWALAGLLTGRFDGVRVLALDGRVRGVPVDSLDVVASGVADGGRTVDSVTARLRADGAGAVASGLPAGSDPGVLPPAVPLPPDRLRVRVPVGASPLVEVPLDLEVLVRASEGALVLEPVAATSVGLDVDLTRPDLPGGAGIAATDLPAGLALQRVGVADDAGRAVVVAELACSAGCRLR